MNLWSYAESWVFDGNNQHFSAATLVVCTLTLAAILCIFMVIDKITGVWGETEASSCYALSFSVSCPSDFAQCAQQYILLPASIP